MHARQGDDRPGGGSGHLVFSPRNADCSVPTACASYKCERPPVSRGGTARNRPRTRLFREAVARAAKPGPEWGPPFREGGTMTRRMAGAIPGAAALVVLGLPWLLAADGPPAAKPPAAGAPAANAPAAPAEAKPLEAGDPAPPFRLQGSDGKTYSLQDFKGKKAVVLAWFPKAFTGG